MIKKLITGFFAVAASASLLSGAQQNWTLGNTMGYLSDGTPFNDIPSFTFEVGSFAAGFEPSGANFAQWEDNWLTANLANNTGSWTSLGVGTFPDHGSASGETIKRTGDSPAQGAQGYIWGYDDKDNLQSGEWILLTNPDWAFPAGTDQPPVLPADVTWRTADEGTVLVFGSQFNHTTEADELQRVIGSQVIPEPSTYALFFGLGILGFLGYRRFRK